MVSGITRTLDLPITETQLEAWASGKLIQNAFPDLSPDEREFLQTGITTEEWETRFKGEEQEELERLDAEADARLLEQEE